MLKVAGEAELENPHIKQLHMSRYIPDSPPD